MAVWIILICFFSWLAYALGCRHGRQQRLDLEEALGICESKLECAINQKLICEYMLLHREEIIL